MDQKLTIVDLQCPSLAFTGTRVSKMYTDLQSLNESRNSSVFFYSDTQTYALIISQELDEEVPSDFSTPIAGLGRSSTFTFSPVSLCVKVSRAFSK